MPRPIVCYYETFLGRCPSPVTRPFATTCFLRLIQENESIRDAVVAIGAAYAIHSQKATGLSDESGLADFLQRKVYAKIQGRLREPDPHVDPSLLPLVVLLCIAQVMTTKSTNICLQLLDQTTLYLVMPRGPHGFSTEFEKSFLLLFRVLQGMGSLQRDQSTGFGDRHWRRTISEASVLQSRDQDTFFFECICTFMTALAELNVQNLSWLEEEKKAGRGFSTYEDHLKTGNEIIWRASVLIKSLEQLELYLINSKPADDSSLDMFFAYCLSLKIGTLRLFAYPPWQSVPLSRAGLQESRIQEYAVSALGHLENRMKHTGLETVLYLSHLVAIAVEIRDLSGRQRVLSLFRTIKERGFIIADIYICDIELAWKIVKPIISKNKV
ncbi:hypothetical protein ACMFMG_002857 [Clarireedia jacksonii]